MFIVRLIITVISTPTSNTTFTSTSISFFTFVMFLFNITAANMIIIIVWSRTLKRIILINSLAIRVSLSLILQYKIYLNLK